MKRILPQVILIPAQQSSTFHDRPAYRESPRDVDVVVTGNARLRYRAYTVFGWTKDGAGRIEHGGPEVQGPYATMSEKACVLTAEPRETLPIIEVSLGSLIEFAGTVYRVQLLGTERGHPRQDYLELIPSPVRKYRLDYGTRVYPPRPAGAI